MSSKALEFRPTLLYSIGTYLVPRWLSTDPKADDLEWSWITILRLWRWSFCTFCRRMALFLLRHLRCCLRKFALSSLVNVVQRTQNYCLNVRYSWTTKQLLMIKGCFTRGEYSHSPRAASCILRIHTDASASTRGTRSSGYRALCRGKCSREYSRSLAVPRIQIDRGIAQFWLR